MPTSDATPTVIHGVWQGRPLTTTILPPGHARQVIVRDDDGADVWAWLRAYRRDADGWAGCVEITQDKDYGGGVVVPATRVRWLPESDVRRPTEAEMAQWGAPAIGGVLDRTAA